MTREERRAQTDRKEVEQLDVENNARASLKQVQEELDQVWLPKWKSLTNEEQAEVIRAVAEKFPKYLQFPKLLEKRCVSELRDRSLRQESAAVLADATAPAG